jgi:hypothetical protein
MKWHDTLKSLFTLCYLSPSHLSIIWHHYSWNILWNSMKCCETYLKYPKQTWHRAHFSHDVITMTYSHYHSYSIWKKGYRISCILQPWSYGELSTFESNDNFKKSTLHLIYIHPWWLFQAGSERTWGKSQNSSTQIIAKVHAPMEILFQKTLVSLLGSLLTL